MAKAQPIKSAVSRYWTFFLRIFVVTVYTIGFQAMRLCPPVRKFILEREHKRCQFDKAGLKAIDWTTSLGSWKSFKTFVHDFYREASLGTVLVGESAPDVSVFTLAPNGQTTPCRLLDFMKPGRPLVINLGSCS